jgi:electron transport complex protein RnfD
MQYKTFSSPHLHRGHSVPWIMRQVLLALVPGVLAYVWYFGFGVVVQLALAMGTAVAAEAAVLRLRRRPLAATLADSSALVTGALLALALPPLAPWWATVLGALFAIVIVKQLFGGIGYNPFNPAMAGYVMLLVSFPREMTQWLPPAELGDYVGPIQALSAVFTGALPGGAGLDAISQATPLDVLRTQLGQRYMLSDITTRPVFGAVAGRGWETIAFLYLLGGVYLIWRKVITWHIPVALLGGLAGAALVFNVGYPDQFASPLFHLFSGGAMLGAFFIATDPVSAATTPKGRLVFGAGIGVLVYIIRTWGGYPDGVAFAVLLMNIAVPTIDHYTQPRVFGRQR